MTGAGDPGRRADPSRPLWFTQGTSVLGRSPSSSAPALGGLEGGQGTRSRCDGLLSTVRSISRHKAPCRSGVPEVLLHGEPGSSPETCYRRWNRKQRPIRVRHGPPLLSFGDRAGHTKAGSSRSKSRDDGVSAVAFPDGDPRKTRRTGWGAAAGHASEQVPRAATGVPGTEDLGDHSDCASAQISVC